MRRVAEMKLNPREKALLEEQKKNKKMRNRYILVGVIVLILAALVIVVNSSLFDNGFAALQVGSDKCTLAEANYEYQSAYMQIANTYGQYGLIDNSKPLNQQTCMFDPNGGTWHDYFLDTAETNLKQKVALYNAAKAAGYTELTEEEQADIDATMESFKLYGSSYGYTLDGYLIALFGQGNNEKTVRSSMMKEKIINRYLNDQYESYSYSDAEKDAYYDEHADEMNKVEYLYVFIPGTADEAAGLDEAAAMAAAGETARTIVADSSGQEDLFRAAVSAAAATEPTETSGSVSGFLSSYEGDVTADQLNPGTVFAHETSGGWHAVYVLGVDDNHYNGVSVRHILVKAVDEDGDGTYSDEEKQAAYDAVLAIQEEWLAGEATEDSFAALANEKSEDAGSNTNGGLYENIYKGQMVQEFSDFCFADHKSGDYGIVYGENAQYAGYHLIYFVGADGELYSRVLADNAMRSEEYNAFVEAAMEPYTAVRRFMWRYVGKDKTE